MQQYRPILDELDLTYPQYITMMSLWETDDQTVNQLGKKLQLDNGTLTPLLKRLEGKELIERQRSKEDERIVRINLTKKGEDLKEKASCVPLKILQALHLDIEDMEQLKLLSDKVLANVKEQNH
ncbi:MarR family transcriptional regulator [Chishuiella sp.]|uniref:MarR family winged helix-turn-helix transcriptional regulator n=1 Tax=Chishuiella sp. TaxID=1969467 RepID=UPI0028AF0D07|nr:MarR family transcriptional regulator [Chishuiella sp.]